MAEYIVGRSAAVVWAKAYTLLSNCGKNVNSRAGETNEVLHTLITIEDPQQKWVYSRRPPISIAFALADLIWILNGSNESEIINAWNPALPNYSGKGSYYYGAYGERIRHRFGFDQLERAYRCLRCNPESRQVVLQIYEPQSDFPTEYGEARNSDIPCNICSLLKIRDNRLEWTQVMRSNDIYRGMPYNFIQFTSIQEVLAGWLNIGVGSYNHFSDSLHLYINDIPKIESYDGVELFNPDSLAICKNDSTKIIKEIFLRMREEIKENIGEKDLYNVAKINCGYQAYDNIMLIISAYIASHKEFRDLEIELIHECTNPLYRKLWDDWIQNHRKK